MLTLNRPIARALLACLFIVACDDVETLGDAAGPPAVPDAAAGADAPSQDAADGHPPGDATVADRGEAGAAILCTDQHPSEGGPGVEGEAVPLTVAAVLSGVSEACWACAGVRCALSLGICADQPGCAQKGPAAGVSRSALCAETLQCLLATNCQDTDPGKCTCDQWAMPGPEDAAPVAPRCVKFKGEQSCRTELERSLELTDRHAIASAVRDIANPAGAAALLAQCLDEQRCTDCRRSATNDAGAD